ncbi:39S ribosomal protein L30, mitochondrial [Orchesella cincta]|uniref:Large ribosomal subunit protein uL30m n=1 Tax=Orchesella cincta TaxID=48709 RepID=A0A1D2M8X2_ORCCI|nr:39S ribosomal protein L30, mitochondrial [Orchesella cincta]
MQSGSLLSLFKNAVRIRSVCGSNSGCLSSALISLSGVISDVPTNYHQQQQQSLLLGGVRFKFSRRMGNIRITKQDPEGVRYPGFVYFPRPGEKDPPVEPTKLFMVKRIRGLAGCPYWEKEYIKELGLQSRRSIAIIKNTPTQNARLYKVKHLVQITPITMPQGMPEDPEHAFLKENGEFIGYNLLSHHDIKLDDAKKGIVAQREKFMDGETLKTRLRTQWYSRYDVI